MKDITKPTGKGDDCGHMRGRYKKVKLIKVELNSPNFRISLSQREIGSSGRENPT